MDEDDIKDGKPFLNAIQQQMRDNGFDGAERIVFRNFTLNTQGRNMQVTMRQDDPTKYDEIVGTAVIASENPVQREIWVPGEGWRIVDEILMMSGLNRARAEILPLLKDHRHYNTDMQIGDWSNIRVDPANPTQMLGDYRISGDDDNQTFCHRFARGYIKTFSCAYTIDSTVTEEADGKITLRIMGWTMYEVSAVAVPADFKSTARCFGMKFERGVNRMDEDEILEGAGSAALETESGSEGESGERSQSQESANDAALRARAAEIGAPAGFVRNFIGTATTPDQMTRKFVDQANARASRDTQGIAATGVPGQPIQVDMSARNYIRNLASVFAKSDMRAAGNTQIEFSNDERQIGIDLNQPVSGRQLLRAIAKKRNVRLPEDFDFGILYELRSIAPHVPEDFAQALSAAVQYVQIAQNDVIPYWGTGITRTIEFTSYNAGVFTLPLVLDELLPTAPGSEVKGGTARVFDTKGVMTTLNRRYPISRVLFDMNGVGLFSNLNGQVNNAAITGENKMLQKKILTNPVMSDGVPFFHGSRFNVATGVARSVDGIGQIQAAAFGDGSGVPFTAVITNPANATALRKLNAQTTATKPEDVNPFGGSFTVVPMPGLPMDMDIWICDPRIRPAFLRMVATGQTQPLMRMVFTAMFDGFELLASADRGVAHGDYRGAFVAFTGVGPEFLPNGEDEANYEAEDIDTVLEQRSAIDWS